jgi:hypothetical protein
MVVNDVSLHLLCVLMLPNIPMAREISPPFSINLQKTISKIIQSIYGGSLAAPSPLLLSSLFAIAFRFLCQHALLLCLYPVISLVAQTAIMKSRPLPHNGPIV